jgi:subtilisin family serine protease
VDDKKSGGSGFNRRSGAISICVLLLFLFGAALSDPSLLKAQNTDKAPKQRPLTVEKQEAAGPNDQTPKNAQQLKTFLEMEDPRQAAQLLRESVQRGEITDRASLKSLKQKKELEEITVFNRTRLSPPPGIERKLLDDSEKTPASSQKKKKTAMLQLTDELGLDDAIALLDLGVKFYSQTSLNTYIVRAEADAIEEIGSREIVRWIGEYRPEYKYRAQDLASDNPIALVYVLGGDRPEYRDELESMGIPVLDFYKTPKCYEVYLDSDRFDDVAELWWVRGILKELPKKSNAMKAVSVNFEPNDSRELIMAYNNGNTGNGVTIGVIDSGILPSHPQLFGIFHAASDLSRETDHGTHVTGIIAARSKTGVAGPWGSTEIKGVAPQASILFRSMDNEPAVSSLSLFSANGVTVSNHSYIYSDVATGDPILGYDQETEDHDRACHDDDILVVASAGNQFDPFSIPAPALGKNVLAVGAINYVSKNYPGFSDKIGERAYYSSQGPTNGSRRLKPDLVAPGGGETQEGVVSTSSTAYGSGDDITRIDGNYQEYEWESDDYFQRLKGTSMAAPHVTGAVAKIKQSFPSYTAERLKALLINTAIPVKGNSNEPRSGYANTQYGYGLVNAFSPTHYYADEIQPVLDILGMIDKATEVSHTINVPAGTKKLAVTLAYNDYIAESDAGILNDDLDLSLTEPGTGTVYRAYQYKPVSVTGESPIEKMIIVNPAPGAWLAKVRYTSGISSKQRYAIVADAILKAPALALTTPGQQFNVAPNQEFNIPITVANYGGHIAAGITVEISGPSSFGGDINKSRYLGNLLRKDESVSPQFKIRAPATPDIYYLQVRADGINKDFDNASYPMTGQVKVYVGAPGQVTYPSASGITWSRGSAYTIKWTGFGAIQNVRIELYKGGTLNSVISDSAPNAAGSFTWTVPAGQALGSDYKVRVTSASNFAVFDESDNFFTIGSAPPSGTITLTYPNAAGISWSAGSSYTITWASTGSPGSSVKIDLLKGGVLNTTISASTENDGSYSWTVPSSQAAGVDYKIRVASTANGAILDESDAAFAITAAPQGTITVASPSAAGLSYTAGSACNITWSSTGSVGSQVRVEVRKGANLIADVITENDGFYAWSIPTAQTPGSDYWVKISSVANPTISDSSDNNFTVAAPAAPTFHLNFPSNSGITFNTGSTYNFTWDSTAPSDAIVKLELFKDSVFVGGTFTQNDGIFAWTILPSYPPGPGYTVKISLASNSAVFDTSDYPFTIVASSYLNVDGITPSEGTLGTQPGMTGSGFGASRGKILIGATKAKILQWSTASVEWLMSKAPLPGVYDLTIAPREPKGVPPTVLPAYFTVKGPEIASLSKNSGFAGEPITISGKFFGTKKGKVLLTDGSGKAFKCKVLSWVMDPKTNAGSIVFAVPKKVYGVCGVTVANKIGSVAATGEFTVQ